MISRWPTNALTILTAAALPLFAGCGPATNTNDDGSDTDSPYDENVGTCGGKCDSTDVEFDLLAGLSIIDRQSADDPSSPFRIAADVAEEHAEAVESGMAARAVLYVVEPEENADREVQQELAYRTAEERDAYETGAFVSRAVDPSALGEWETLRVRITGEVGEKTYDQIFEFASGADDAEEITAESGPFEEAYDVDAAIITIDPEVAAPEGYRSPSVDGPFGLGGTEFWQKWPDGENPTYSYGDGTPAGQKCMTASAIRFTAIMEEPPEELVQLEEESNWSGRFFNWNDDFSHEEARGSARSSTLWAWRTSLMKWISQTGKEGKCYLPTEEQVIRAAENCLRKAERNDGEIEGCQAR